MQPLKAKGVLKTTKTSSQPCFFCCPHFLLFTEFVHGIFWQILHILCRLGQIPEDFAEDSHEEARAQSSLEEITITGEALTILLKDMDFWHNKPFLTTKLFKPQILCIHGESPNVQFLPPHPEQIKHLKQNQHLSSTSGFPYFNVEHKLGHKDCLLWSNSGRKSLNHSDERMDRRHLISFPRCHNTQQLADWFFKSKLQQHQQQQTDMQSLGVQWWPRALPSKPDTSTTPVGLTSKKGERPRTYGSRGRQRVLHPECAVRAACSVNPSTPPLAKHAVPQSRAGIAQTQPCRVELCLHKARPCNTML